MTTYTQINRYRVIRPLGRGGMAEVHLAKDPQFDREVAIKVMPPAYLLDPTFRSRFELEAKSIANLEHSAILPVYDYDQFAGKDEVMYPYLVMRYMPGGTLEERITAEGKFSLQNALSVIRRIGAALTAAHRQQIIHRDIKPANILFDNEGDSYLADFGIVKIMSETQDISRMTGGIIGTPAYMSPEQVKGKKLDGRSDIYSLGIVLYEMLTGQQPYRSETPTGLMMAHVLDPVPDILTEDPTLPFALQAVIHLALAKDPADRYSDIDSLIVDLEDIARGDMPRRATAVMAQPAPSTVVVPDPTEVEPKGVVTEPVPPPFEEADFRPVSSTVQKRMLNPFLIVLFILGLGGTVTALVPSLRQAMVGFFPIAELVPESPTPNTDDMLATAVARLHIGATQTAAAALELMGTPTYTPVPPTEISEPEAAPKDTPSQPMATAIPTRVPTARPAATPVPPTATPVIPTATPMPRIEDFQVCLTVCNGSNAVREIPGGTEQIFIFWTYHDIPIGSSYSRFWRTGRGEWVRYNCSWNGPSSGFFADSLREPNGLLSGPWQVQIIVDGQILLDETITVTGNWQFWQPAGTFNNRCSFD